MNFIRRILNFFLCEITCPGCQSQITWNQNWQKWNCCANCNFNPNYLEDNDDK